MSQMCDKCKKCIGHYTKVTIPTIVKDKFNVMDLCSSCTDLFLSWLSTTEEKPSTNTLPEELRQY